MKFRKKLKDLALAGFLLLCFSVSPGPAWANGPVQIVPLFARAEVAVASMDVSTCQAVDGVYTVVHVTGQGPIVSQDTRMQGTFFADAMILTNPQGKGISRDNFKIRDTATGRLKVKGSGFGIHSDPSPIHAQAFARLADGSRFWSESTVRLPAPGTQDPIVIEYGGEGSGDPADRGVIITGSCREIFDLFDDE